MKEIPMLRPFGEPSQMKIIVNDDFEMEYIKKRIKTEGELRVSPFFDDKGNLVAVIFPDVLQDIKMT